VKRFKYYLYAIFAGFKGLLSYSTFLVLTNFLIRVFFIVTVPDGLGLIVPVAANCCCVADMLPDYLLFLKLGSLFALLSIFKWS